MPAPIKLRLPDGQWTCRWVNDFHYGKSQFKDGDIYINCEVTYTNEHGAIQEVHTPVNSLFRTIAGSRLQVKQQVATVLPYSQQDFTIYNIKIPQELASDVATQLHHHLQLDGSQHHRAYKYDSEYKQFTHDLGLPIEFGFSYAHCIPEINYLSGIDYFIIPSYEVLRYFFMQGNKLPSSLLSLFTGQGEHATKSINELVVNPTGEPLIFPYKGMRRAYFQVKEGFSKPEIYSLARVAFIPSAYACIEQVKESLLVNSVELINRVKRPYEYRSIQTILPQDKPFEMAVFGRSFLWKGKTYVLVDRICNTKEEMPFDFIDYRPLIDHGRAINSSASKSNSIPKEKTVTKPAISFKLTADERGSDAQAANITDDWETNLFIEPQVTINKLPKLEEGKGYPSIITPELHEYISLLEQKVKDAEAGRGNVHRQREQVYEPNHSNVRSFFEALTKLKHHTCSYFNTDYVPARFSEKYYLNHTLIGFPYRVLLCLLQPVEAPNTHFYIVWAGTIRYGLFYTSSFNEIHSSVLSELCAKVFGKNGVTLEFEDSPFNDYRTILSDYTKHNPAGLNALGLVTKIENRLTGLVDNRKRQR